MANLAFPLKLERSFLARCDKRESVIQILRLMAQTPHGSWKGCPSFGLRNLFEDARRTAEAPRKAIDAINESLADLGVEGWRVAAIEADNSPDQETRSYSVVVESTADPAAPPLNLSL